MGTSLMAEDPHPPTAADFGEFDEVRVLAQCR
jgi:hypothetical protein